MVWSREILLNPGRFLASDARRAHSARMGKRIGTRAFSSAIGALLLVLVAAPRHAGAEDAGAAPPVPACIQVHSESRYVPFGYNHIVVLKSTCAKDATCTISTDVNPTPVTAEVAKGTTQEVVTWAGSPASTFNAKVACKLH